MELTITTPALLFPTVSLILLAYTNRFLAVAALIRKLAAQYKDDHSKIVADQIKSLRLRVRAPDSRYADAQHFGFVLERGVYVLAFYWPGGTGKIYFQRLAAFIDDFAGDVVARDHDLHPCARDSVERY
jgi:hypothetical protein